MLGKTKLDYCLLRHLETARVVGVAIGIAYFHRVDHSRPTGWADDGAYIL